MQQQPRRFPPLQCHYCKKIGHKQVDCFYFFKDSKRNQGFMNGGFPLQQQTFQTPGLSAFSGNGTFSGNKRSRNERDDERYQERFDQPQHQQQHQASHQQQQHHQLTQQHQSPHQQYQESQANECKESCCYRPKSPTFSPVDDFTEAIRYLAQMRDELGKEKFKDFEPETFLGKKVHKALISVENEL
jgi:hypothetical protein